MEQDTSFRHPSPWWGSHLWWGALLGGLLSVPIIALSYLGAQWADLPFIPFDLFDWLARVLPGNVITVGIDTMVRVITLLGLGQISATAKSMEQAMGVVLVVVAGAVLGFIIAWIIERTHRPGRQIGAWVGVLAWALVVAVEMSLGSALVGNGLVGVLWLAILIVGWGALVGYWLAQPPLAAVPVTTPEEAASRRAFLIRVGAGAVGLAVVATGLGRLLEIQRQASGAGQPLSSLAHPPAGTPPVANAPTAVLTPAPQETTPATPQGRVAPAPGTRPEVTANKDFYRIDIDTLPPVLDGASWKLQVTGLFARPRPLALSDLLAYPAVTQPITQACISNPIGGDLISTTNYTGARLRDVLQDLGLQPQARALYLTSADGFYETVEMADLMDQRTLLVYGMNGDTLPVEHGYPLRIYIPNRYGMKQPKWITAMEAIDGNGRGYWVDRGWSAAARPQILSIVDAVAKNHIENGRVPIGGIAWAGDRGIQKVEVQVDGGPWAAATLLTPPLGPLAWVQWRYDWPVAPGSHTFRVRATDGTGALQVEAVADTYPNGATGYHTARASF